MYQASETRYNEMEYRRCGESGLKLPVVSLGMWHNFGKTGDFETMKQMCFAAFDAGICHFDLANNYGFPDVGSAEESLGRILKEEMSAYRRELIISTKAGYKMWEGPYGDFGSRKSLLASLDESLKRLGLEYVDIFYHHRPDPETPLEETVSALVQAVQSGKALYVGLSNYDGPTMKRAAALLREHKCPFVMNQNRHSIFDRRVEENGLLAAAQEEGKGVIVFSPLEQGVLSDKYLKGIPETSRIRTSGIYLKEANLDASRMEKVQKLNELALSHGRTLAQMALLWVLSKPVVTSVLIGASSPEQIRENAAIAKLDPLSPEELQKIDEIVRG